MKNFTKTITNKTLFKPTRWLIMALMLLVGTSSAWGADYWVVGPAVGGWDQWKEMDKQSDTRYTYSVNSGEFKITKADNWDDSNRLDDIGCNDNNDTYKGNVTCNGANNHSANVSGTLCFNPNDSYMWIEPGAVDPCATNCYVAGEIPGCNWGKDVQMTCENGSWSKVFNNIDAGTYKFKIIKGDSWIGNFDNNNGNVECENVGSENNIQFTTTSKGNITISFDGEKAWVTFENSCASASYTVSFENNTTSVNKGSKLQASVSPNGDGYGNVTWLSSAPGVATVSSTGLITGVKFGTSTITATVADGATYCGGTATKPITVKETPTITIGGETVFCGESTTLTATITGLSGGNGYYIKWYKQGDNNAKGDKPTFSPTESGTYIVKVTGDFVNETSNTVVVTKKAYPTAANFTVTNNNYTYDGAAKAATVKWNDNQSTEGINITYEPASPIDAGSYDIKVTTSEHGDLCASNEAITLTEKLTITQATQTGFEINNTTLNICGTSVVVTSTGGQGGYVTYTIATDNTTTKDATINSTTGELKVNSAGTVIVTATKGATTNYEESTNSKEFTFIMLPNVALKETSISVCSNEEINLSEYVSEQSGTIKWYSDSEYKTEITELNFIPNNQIYYVKATNGECTPATAALDVSVTQVPSQPEIDTVDPQCDSYTLPTNDKNGPIKWYDSNGSVLASNTITQSGTYYAEGVNGNCVSDSRTEVEVTINKTPTITGKSVTQPDTEITLTSTQGVTWSVSPTENVILTDNGDGTATFSASVVREFVVSARNENCSIEYPITVTDKGNIIYVRRPKSEDGNNYTYWYNSAFMGEEYYGTQNYIKNGADFSTASENNQNGTAPTVPAAFTDCDGYVWDKFEVLGYESFFVHAPVQTGFGGYSTFTQTIDVALEQPEMYVTIGTWVSGLGAPITKVEAPSLVKVYASGETTLGANKFAALYVTDCSGREIDTYQWEYRSTEDETYTNYTASVSNSGTLYSGDAGTTNNIRPSDAGFYRCTVTYKGGGTATSAAEEVTGTYSYLKSNIPVIVVNTNGVGFPDCPSTGGTASKNADVLKEKRSVDVKIYDGETLVYDRKARMNYRGSSSLNFVKKSYAFCPGDANCEEKDGQADYVKTAKLNMLGVGQARDKDWVLYAAAADPSLMRNRLVFDSFKAMTGKWGVNSRYVELIVDGVYKGVYVFMDKITMNKNRVKVDEDKGFIVKFDKTDKEDRVGGYNGILGDEKTFKTSYTGKDDIGTYDTSIDQRFEIEYPEKDDYTTGWKARVDGIQGMFQAFEDALKQGDYATVQKYIDYTSWADWFIINEFTKNVDAYRASCIFVYTGEAGAKIEARPLWDQELSFNNQASLGTSDKGSNSTTGLLIQHSNVYSDAFGAPFWFTGGGSDITGGLLSDPCFVQVVKERWNMHQFGALSKKSLEDLVDEYEDDLAPEGTTDNAQTRETAFWNGKSRGTCDCSYDTSNATATGYQNKTFEESTGTITNWISDDAANDAKGRRAGLTTALNNLTGASFSIQIIPSEAKTTPWEPVEIAVSVTPAGYDYKLEYTDNDLGSVANTIIKEEGDKITYRIPRPWDSGDAEEGERPDIEYGIKATLSVQEGTTVCGSQAAPSSTGKIILQDEPNDECPQ